MSGAFITTAKLIKEDISIVPKWVIKKEDGKDVGKKDSSIYVELINKVKKVKSSERVGNCIICGRFMRRLKLVERCAISANGGGERTHICLRESYNVRTEIWEHDDKENDTYKISKRSW